jgi:tRNA G18 (ribose-2'-O)-methylase SpoU
VVARLLATPGWRVRSLLVADDRWERFAPLVAAAPPDVAVWRASQPVIDRLTGFNLHRGLLAAADRPLPRPWSELVPAAGGRLLLVEDVNDQENLGALFRSAAALGVDALLTSPGTCDPLYRRTVRVSMGATFRVPFATLAPWPDGLADLVAAGWTIVALTPSPDALDLDSPAGVALRHRGRLAVLVGAEGPGLSEGALAAATAKVRVAMAPGVDSLNVVVAAAIALHALRPSA